MSDISARRGLPGLSYPEEYLRRPLDGNSPKSSRRRLGCGDACPVYPGNRYQDWALEDPADLPIEDVRRVRDQIRSNVVSMLAQLGIEAKELTL